MGCTKAVLRVNFIAIQAYPQETRKVPNKQPNATPKGTRKTRTNKAQSKHEGNS